MKRSESKIDKLFRSQLEEYYHSSYKPDWEKFTAGLEYSESQSRLKKRRRIIITGFICALSSVVIILLNSSDSHLPDKVEKSMKPLKEVSNAPGLTILNHKTSTKGKKREEFRSAPAAFCLPTESTSPATELQARHDLSLSPNEIASSDAHLFALDEALATAGPALSIGGEYYKIDIVNLGMTINSSYSDYGPVVSADGGVMIFTSRRPITEKDISKKKEVLEHVYVANYHRKKRAWSTPALLYEGINEAGRNNSAIALSNDGQRLLLYRDDINGNGDIYESNLNGTVWMPPVSVGPPVNSEFHESSSSIAHDGSTIYFVSDRPGGFGGRDIWRCAKTANGTWEPAQNLGPNINTNLDEEGIYIHPDGKTIYFSSKGHGSIGGYDIFKATLEKDGWSTPENLSAPINTRDDDLCFVMEANGKVAYFSSIRENGHGEKDIYRATFSKISVKDVRDNSPKLTLLKGRVTNEANVPLEAAIEITDHGTKQIVSRFRSNSATGNYLISLPSGHEFGISVKADGHLFYSEHVNIPASSGYTEVEKEIRLKKIEVGKSIELRNIFFDYDKSILRNESVIELERVVTLMSENPMLKFEISSHTDNLGSQEYNIRLSQARAESVVSYLIGRGISKSRLTAVGYGEIKPLVPNQNPDGTDNPEGRQLNRRIEFKIVAL